MSEHFGPEHLHAPWRMDYIEQAGTPAVGCIFCEKPRQQCDRDNYVLYPRQLQLYHPEHLSVQ